MNKHADQIEALWSILNIETVTEVCLNWIM